MSMASAATVREVYDNRQIPRAHENGLVRQWQDRFVAPPSSNPFSKGSGEPPTTFRRTPDSAWPPPAAEVASVPLQPTDPYILTFTSDITGISLLVQEPLQTLARRRGGPDRPIESIDYDSKKS